MRNSPPLSEDPADTMDNKKHCPDGPTEPPDQRKGTRGRGGELRVQLESWEVENDDNEGVEAHRKSVVTQEPETHRDMQVQVERSRTHRGDSIKGERTSVLVHRESMRAVENDQHTSTIIDVVPECPPDPPAPPDETTRPRNKPPSVKLEGERRTHPSCDTGPTRGDTDASGVSSGGEDARNRLKKLHNTSECINERSKRRTRETSPDSAQVDPNNPGVLRLGTPKQRLNGLSRFSFLSFILSD